MAGVYFIVWVPTEEYEKSQRNNCPSPKPNTRNNEAAEPNPIGQKGHDRSYLPVVGRDSGNFSADNISFKSTEGNNSPFRPTSEDPCSNNVKIPIQDSRYIPLERMLNEILENLRITDAFWCLGGNSRYKQVTFCLASGPPCEDALRMLTNSGIGVKLNSIVSVIPCSIYYQGDESNLSPSNKVNPQEQTEDQEEATAWEKFLESARPRLILAQVVESVKHNAVLNFDFVVLLIIAALFAALGEVMISSFILVASMILSPMMGPITAVIFGTLIHDKKLQKMGVRNELLALLICVVIGFLFGLSVCFLGNYRGYAEWPTREMLTKAQKTTLWVEMMVALLSGAAIAIAIRGEQTSPMIGVAISVALLPPAVNAGLLWSLALYNLLPEETAPYFVNYVPLWSPRPAVELAILGGISLFIAVMNIICIFITGILLLKLKEAIPRKGQKFWNPLSMAKDYQPFTSEEANAINEKLGEEIFSTDNNSDMPIGSQCPDFIGINQYTWSPASTYSHPSVTSLFHDVNLRQFKSRYNIVPARRLSGSLSHLKGSVNSLPRSRVSKSPCGETLPTIPEKNTPARVKTNRFTVIPTSDIDAQ